MVMVNVRQLMTIVYQIVVVKVLKQLRLLSVMVMLYVSSPTTSSPSRSVIPFTPVAVRPKGRNVDSGNRINDACAVPIKISSWPLVKP
jgi:hypothetical protein